MAGDWIKFETATVDKPEVLKLARLLGIPKTQALGAVVAFWCWMDANAVDGAVDGVVDGDVDALVDVPGFADALQRVGWLVIHSIAERVEAPKFDRHNGKSAKNRALKTERQRKWRDKSVDAHVDAAPSTREEKRREEIKETSSYEEEKKVRKRTVFSEPTVSDVSDYCAERCNGIDAEAFVAYYQSVNWHVGKKRMSCWKAAVRTWEKRNAETKRANGGRTETAAERFSRRIGIT